MQLGILLERSHGRHLSELLRAPIAPRNEHSAGNSDKNRELTTSSEIKGPENIVPVDTFQGMSLAWHTPDAADGSRGSGD